MRLSIEGAERDNAMMTATGQINTVEHGKIEPISRRLTKAIADEYRSLFLDFRKVERPPCFNCPDVTIVRCREQEIECTRYKQFVIHGK